MDCGVCSALYTDSVVRDLYTVAMGLQHRGQESAGFALSMDGGGDFVATRYGPVKRVFSDFADSVRSSSRSGIAHVRYSTTGGSNEANAQPLRIVNPRNGNVIVIGHNGNAINGQGLREQYAGEYDFQSTTDTEAMGYILSCEDDFASGARRLFDEVEGSFNLVAFNQRGEVALIRDRDAYHPFVWSGYREGQPSYAASENIALAPLGVFGVKEVPPGSLFVFGKDGGLTTTSFGAGPGCRCPMEPLYFMRHGSDYHLPNGTVMLVDDLRRTWGRMLFEKYRDQLADVDVFSYVPESGRGYFMGLMGLGISAPLEDVFSRNKAVGRTYISPAGKGEQMSKVIGLDRIGMTGLKNSPIVSRIKGRRLALLDDTAIRGNATKAVAQVVFSAGAESVHFLYAGSPFRYPCFYGMDHSRRRELVNRHREDVEDVGEANELFAREVAEEAGVDPSRVRVGFLGLSEMMKPLGGIQGNCHSCWTGEYPHMIPAYLQANMKPE